MRGMALVVVIVVAAVAALAGCQRAGQPEAAPQQAQPEQQTAAPAGAAEEEEPKTPVVMKAYYPFNEDHKFIADYLKELEKAHPGQVTVRLYDTQTPEGQQAWQKTGLSCMGIFINGKTRWAVKRPDGSTEEVDFLKRMDTYWKREDLKLLVEQLLAEAKAKQG